MAQIKPPGLEAHEMHLSDGEQGLSSPGKSPGKSKMSMLGKVRNRAKKLRDKIKKAASSNKDETHEGQDAHEGGTDSHDEEDETSSEFNSGDQAHYQQLRSIGALGSEPGHASEEGVHGGQAAGEVDTKTQCQPIDEDTSSMTANQGSPATSTHWTTDQENDTPITPFKSAGPPDALQAVPTEYRNYAVNGIPLDDSKESHPAGSFESKELSPAGEKSSELSELSSSRDDNVRGKDLEPDFLGLPSPPQGNDPAVDGKESLSSPGALRGDENAVFQDDLVKPNPSFGEPSPNSAKVGVLNVDPNGKQQSNVESQPVAEAEEPREDYDEASSNLLPEAGRYSEYGAEPQLPISGRSSGDPYLKSTTPEKGTAAAAGEDYPHEGQSAMLAVKHHNSENADYSKEALASEFGSEDTLEEESTTGNAESASGNMEVSDRKSSDEVNSREATPAEESLASELGGLELGDKTTGTAENYVDAGEDYYDPGPLADERQEGLSSKDGSVDRASSNDSPVSSVTDRATGTLLGLKNTVVSKLGYGGLTSSPGDTNATDEEETSEGKLVPEGAIDDEVPVIDRVSRPVEGLKESASSLGYGSDSKASEDDSAVREMSIDGDVKEQQSSNDDESRSASRIGGYGESKVPEDAKDDKTVPVTERVSRTVEGLKESVSSKLGLAYGSSSKALEDDSSTTGVSSDGNVKEKESSNEDESRSASGTGGYGEPKVPEEAEDDKKTVPVTERVSRTVEGLKETVSSKLGLGYGSSSSSKDDSATTRGVSSDENLVKEKQSSNEDESRTAASDVVGYGEESSDKSVIADAPVDHSTYTQKLYDTSAAARDYISSKVGYPHTVDHDDPNQEEDGEMKQKKSESDEKGDSSDSFMARFSSPGEEDKALSQIITDTVSNSAVALKQKLADGISAASSPAAKSAAADNASSSPRSADDTTNATPDSSSPDAAAAADQSSPTSILGRVTNVFNTYMGRQPTSPVQQQHHQQEIPQPRAVEEEMA